MVPLAWFGFGGFSSFLNYRRQKDALKLIQTYAERGQEPPVAPLAEGMMVALQPAAVVLATPLARA